MTTELFDVGIERREVILQAAGDVFLRYGYKKTSMEDVARAAGLSRQGLYLHFSTKELLFTGTVVYLTEQSKAAMRAALSRVDLPIEERVLAAFVALKSNSDGSDMPLEHMEELFATATRLVGGVLHDLDQAVAVDLARSLQSNGVAALWKELGLSAKDLAEQLLAASHGIKHYAKNTAEYRERMRVAVSVICRSAVRDTKTKSIKSRRSIS